MATQHLPQADQANCYSHDIADADIGKFDSIVAKDKVVLTERKTWIQEDKINKHSEDPCPDDKDV